MLEQCNLKWILALTFTRIDTKNAGSPLYDCMYYEHEVITQHSSLPLKTVSPRRALYTCLPTYSVPESLSQ